MSMELIKEFIDGSNERKKLEARINQIKERMGKIEPVLTEYFAIEGLQNMKMKEGTAYLKRDVVASLVRDENGEHEGAINALRKAGLGYLVKEGVNSQTLNAYVREAEKNEDEIPQGVRPFLKVSEMYKLRVRA